jgi:hypothetical protein
MAPAEGQLDLAGFLERAMTLLRVKVRFMGREWSIGWVGRILCPQRRTAARTRLAHFGLIALLRPPSTCSRGRGGRSRLRAHGTVLVA